MTHHESKKVVLERGNFPPKSCSSSSQSTCQSATSWMIIMHPTCCRNSPGLTLTLDLVLFIYREILMSEANFMDGIPWPFSVTRRSAPRPVLFFPPGRTNGANDATYEKKSLSSAFSMCFPSEGISMREPQRGNVLKWTNNMEK